MELEVTKKVRLAIKAKLLELGVHVDEELPDYIMILIANRRTKIQMEDDLSLFLGDNTLKFTSWLFQVLKKLEEVTTAPPQNKNSETKSVEDSAVATSSNTAATTATAVKKTTDDSPPSTVTIATKQEQSKEPVKGIVIKSRPSTIVATSEEKNTKVDISSSTVKRKTPKDQLSSGLKSPVLKKQKTSQNSPVLSSKKSTRSNRSSLSPEKTIDSDGPKYVGHKDTKVSSSSPKRLISMRSKSPITAPARSKSRNGRSRSPTTSTQLSSQVKTVRKESHSPGSGGTERDSRKRRLVTITRDKIRSPQTESASSVRSLVVYNNSTTAKSSKSRSRSPLARKSLKSLVAVVKRHNEINAMKDEEYNPSRPAVTSSPTKGVSSVVHVTERPKRATKQERGSNALLVRALADAYADQHKGPNVQYREEAEGVTPDTSGTESEIKHPKPKKSIFGKTTSSIVDDGKEKESKDTASRHHDNDDYDKTDKQSVVSRRRTESDSVDGRQQHGQREQLSDGRRRKKDSSGGNKKLSIKERLGYRVENKKTSRLETEAKRSRYSSDDDLESDSLDGDFTQGVDGSTFQIRVNVGASKSAKDRNVTLEKFVKDASTKQSTVQPEISAEPKRLSIQLNVDSESSDEDELEIQPRPSEDINFESASSIPPVTSKDKSEEGQETALKDDTKIGSKQSSVSASSNSENSSEGEETKENKKDKSKDVIYKQRKSSPEASQSKQQLKQQDNDDEEEEEEEMEEYEIEEEEEDDDEYELEKKTRDSSASSSPSFIVIEEPNIRLSNPDEYDEQKKAARIHEMEMHGNGEDEYYSTQEQMQMETMDKEALYLTNSPGTSFDMDTDGLDARYAIMSSKSYGDTKFVVTMDGSQGSDAQLYADEMETDQYGYSPDTMDLRHKIRIARTVVQSKPPASVNHHHNFSSFPSTPLTSSLYNASSRAYLPITGAPLRPAAMSNVGNGGGGAPACKYWPDCTFKDKCVYPHPKCKYGHSCTKPNCAYKHEPTFGSNTTFDTGHGSHDLTSKALSNNNSSATTVNENDGKVQCKFFPKCHSMSCTFYHPSACRFGVGCTNVKCKNYHPGQTVGQQRSQMLPFGSSSRASSTRVIPPAAALRWKAPTTLESVSNNKDTNLAASSSSTNVDSTSISASAIG